MNKIKVRRGTTTDWAAVNPILDQGEISYDLTVKKFKIGNGTDHWNDLPYDGSGNAVSVSATGTSTNEVSYITIDSTEYKMAGGGSGGTIDTVMSDSSTNAVQNKVIKAYVDSQSGAVNSVNGKTGTVVLTGADINVGTSDTTKIGTAIGTIASLVTSAKTSLVAAINEVFNKFTDYLPLTGGALTGNVTSTGSIEANSIVADLSCQVPQPTSNSDATNKEYVDNADALKAPLTLTGALEDLTTTVKTNLVAAINELVTSIASVVSSLANYLPLAGGTMTGAITFTGSSYSKIKRDTDDSGLTIIGGTSNSNSPSIELDGGSNSSNPGRGRIKVTDGTNAKDLIMLPDGTLTWDSKNVARLGFTATHGLSFTAQSPSASGSFDPSSFKIDLGGGYYKYHVQMEISLTGTITQKVSTAIGLVSGFTGAMPGATSTSRISCVGGYLGSTNPIIAVWGIWSVANNGVNLFIRTPEDISTTKTAYVWFDILTKE